MKSQTDQPAVIKGNGAVIIEENDKKHSVNCFLPLLDQNDVKILPLLSSSIFNIVMTYNLLNDADQSQEDSYQSLLVNTYNHLC